MIKEQLKRDVIGLIKNHLGGMEGALPMAKTKDDFKNIMEEFNGIIKLMYLFPEYDKFRSFLAGLQDITKEPAPDHQIVKLVFSTLKEFYYAFPLG